MISRLASAYPSLFLLSSNTLVRAVQYALWILRTSTSVGSRALPTLIGAPTHVVSFTSGEEEEDEEEGEEGEGEAWEEEGDEEREEGEVDG